VIEISTSPSGLTPSWTVLEDEKDYSISRDTGKVYLHESVLDSASEIAYSRWPSYQVAARFRATYITGVDSIPTEIKRLCIKIAARELRNSVVNKAHALGMNDFNPEPLNFDDAWIEKTLMRFKRSKSELI
jgi:hypothetical protein